MKKLFTAIAKKLKFINPNLLNLSALIINVGAAICFAFASQYSSLFLWAIGLIILRLIFNAVGEAITVVEWGTLSLKDQIINALPDRYSDIILILGITLSGFCNPIYALLALASMFLISYSGLLGKALGVEWQNQGPLGVVARLIWIMVFTLIQYLMAINGLKTIVLLGVTLTSLEWCMLLFLIFGQVTVFNRIRGINKQGAKLAWLTQEKYKGIYQKILIAYDSQTGNTERVAEEVSNCLKVGIRKIDDIKNVESYDLVIFGSPDTGRYPSPKISKFLSEHKNIKNYAVFITYRNPIWGPISTWMCFSYFRKVLNKTPLAVFSCKGVFNENQLYFGHPMDTDLLNAFLFGMKLARKIKKIC